MQGNIDFGNFAKNIIPATDEAIDLGSNTKKFNELYLSGGTIYLGEETISVNAQGSLQLPSAVQIGNIRMTDNEGSFELMNMSTNAVPTSSNVLSDTVVLTQAS